MINNPLYSVFFIVYVDSLGPILRDSAAHIIIPIGEQGTDFGSHRPCILFLVKLLDVFRKEQRAFNFFPGLLKHFDMTKGFHFALINNDSSLLGILLTKPSFGLISLIDSGLKLAAYTFLRILCQGCKNKLMTGLVLNPFEAPLSSTSDFKKAEDSLFAAEDNETFFMRSLSLMRLWDNKVTSLIPDDDHIGYASNMFLKFFEAVLNEYFIGGSPATNHIIRGTRTWEEGYKYKHITRELKNNNFWKTLMKYITRSIPKDISLSVHFAIIENGPFNFSGEDRAMVDRYQQFLERPQNYTSIRRKFF